jgi:hypothetical protein
MTWWSDGQASDSRQRRKSNGPRPVHRGGDLIIPPVRAFHGSQYSSRLKANKPGLTRAHRWCSPTRDDTSPRWIRADGPGLCSPKSPDESVCFPSQLTAEVSVSWFISYHD